MIYPAALEQLGLYVALQAGGVREAWNATHRIGQPRLKGDPCALGVGLQLAAYRLVVDAVSLLLKCECGQISVSIRCGSSIRKRGAFICVALVDRHASLGSRAKALANELLLGRVLAHAGYMDLSGNRLRMVLTEARDAPRQAGAAEALREAHAPWTLAPPGPRSDYPGEGAADHCAKVILVGAEPTPSGSGAGVQLRLPASIDTVIQWRVMARSSNPHGRCHVTSKGGSGWTDSRRQLN